MQACAGGGHASEAGTADHGLWGSALKANKPCAQGRSSELRKSENGGLQVSSRLRAPGACSIFSQILQLFPRLEFESAVRKHKAERHARGFTSWGQFVAMLFCQLGHA